MSNFSAQESVVLSDQVVVPVLPRQRANGLLVAKVAAEHVIYDQNHDKGFCLNEVATAVWQGCDGAHTLDALAASASNVLGTEVPQDSVVLAVDELYRNSLLDRTSVFLEGGDQSRRQLLLRLGKGSLLMLPIVAMLAAPEAAQAYNGCVDCTSPSSVAARKARR